MGWIALSLGCAVLLAAFFAIYLKWIAPWRDVEEIADAVVNSRAPRKFLISANPRAGKIGLALETLSDRHRALEKRAHEGEFNVQSVLGAMLDGLLVVDERRRILVMNSEFRRLLGVNETAPGTPLLEIIRDVDVDRLVAQALDTKEPRREAIRLSRGGIDGLHLEVSAVPLRENPASMQGAVVLFRDITHLRQVEEMRRDFVANVSHELRTPLSIFRGYLETLLDDPKQPPGELLRILGVMEKHSDRLNALVDDVLSLARLEAAEPQLAISGIHLPDFLGAILRDWEKRFAAKKLRAELDTSSDLPLLHADEARLQEIIYNLLDNAVKYSNVGGSIMVRAKAEGDRIRLSVTDQGVGIPMRDLPRIFERFYRADKARSRELGGTGLGLSIVKHIAQLHGGSVEAESEFGVGTTISVILPLETELKTQNVTET
jgi:two-component system phosphate regulon sensor histidine kinase PhoR